MVAGESTRGGLALTPQFSLCPFVPTVPSSGTNGLSIPADCTGTATSTSLDNPTQRSPPDEAPAPEVRLCQGREHTSQETSRALLST